MVGLAGFLLLTSVNWTSEVGSDAPHHSKPVKSHGTVISAVLDVPLTEGQNTLWCGTFQLAWNSAGETAGFPIRLTPQPALADALNKRTFDRKWIDEASITIAGGRNTVALRDSIKDGMKSKWDRAPRFLKSKPGVTEDFIFYAALHKQLQFPQPFAKLGSRTLAGNPFRVLVMNRIRPDTAKCSIRSWCMNTRTRKILSWN